MKGPSETEQRSVDMQSLLKKTKTPKGDREEIVYIQLIDVVRYGGWLTGKIILLGMCPFLEIHGDITSCDYLAPCRVTAVW